MYNASIENRVDTKYYASAGNYAYVMDTEGHGIGPVDALMASLCACLGHYVRDFMRKEKAAYTSFNIKAEAGSSQNGRRLGDISVVIAMSGAELDERQERDLLAYVEACKIHATLKANGHIAKQLKRV